MSDVEAKLDAVAKRGAFVKCSLDFKKRLAPTFGTLYSTNNKLSVHPNVTFWVDKIGWTYTYFDTGHPKAKMMALQPIHLTIKDSLSMVIFSGDHSGQYVPADHFLHGSVDIDITNPNKANFHLLEVTLVLDGTLVIPFNEQFYYLEHRIWKGADKDVGAKTAVCQCSLKTIMSTGCQCGGA